ncbi:branched chain amino acid aminotransferase [Actinophytocola xinjiangensis]|uniref:Branched-chain-amino-acid aminotransferase n=1 Tax=Actinophytocola xinjiangensis TaxID=485602 RepID=A0A7Z0WGZ8_9PSEU|nr:branched-chain amino acid aminotransferase [Actinophytocola xinjiangensis]OLF06970.1 branched chain amino acid aminotransferase [Actinophytocola xinjiangensis]
MTALLNKPETTSPGHGDAFTRNLYSLRYSPDLGWHGGTLAPMTDLRMHPATIGLHYGQVIFEGMKAFRQADGSMAVFRPYENARRFQRSAARLAMPELPEELYVSGVDQLVAADQVELSDDPDHSLYLRPLMFGTDANLMLRPSQEYLFLVMAFVAGGFFGDKVEPVSVLISRDQARAMPGGTGNVKCAANYGPSFVAQRRAQEAGCQQVVWLDAAERTWVEEMGGMNLFFVRGNGAGAEVFTTPLTGTLLPGVTRDSLLTLAAQHGYRVGESPVSVDQWRAECAAGTITEVFACGTAAVVTPVGRVRDRDGDFVIGDGEMGPVTGTLRSALMAVQRGTVPDPHGWLHHVR